MREGLIFWILSSLLVAVVWVGLCMYHRRYDITDEKAIRAIVGEYARNDAKGMWYMAHAIRNRGTLKGVYGFNAKHNKKEPKYIWKLARDAWFSSGSQPDITKGATEWRSRDDIYRHGWPKGFMLTKYYDGVYYFKQTKQGGRS